MTSKEFKTIARLLKEVYAELEADALKSGVSLLSDQFKMVQDKARLAILEQNGFTLEEYRKAKADVAGFSPADMLQVAQDLEKTKEDIKKIKIPTKEEIAQIAYEIAQEFVVPPQITNQIVERTTIEKPKIVKETVKVTEKVEYNDKPLQEKIGAISKRVDEIKIPSPVDVKKIEERLTSIFQEMFEHNIDILGMPNFRKLSMGLRQDIDTKVEGVYTSKITVSAVAPVNPKLNDLWVDIS